MSAPPALILRDVHDVPAPPWWPPAPGWWWLAAAVVVLALCAAALWWKRRRARRHWCEVFDAALAHANGPQARLVAMSDLLRRAARRVQSDADRLNGEAWLARLDDGMPEPVFTDGVGRLIAHGLYAPQVSDAEVRALETWARLRFMRWMGVR